MGKSREEVEVLWRRGWKEVGKRLRRSGGYRGEDDGVQLRRSRKDVG